MVRVIPFEVRDTTNPSWGDIDPPGTFVLLDFPPDVCCTRFNDFASFCTPASRSRSTVGRCPLLFERILFFGDTACEDKMAVVARACTVFVIVYEKEEFGADITGFS